MIVYLKLFLSGILFMMLPLTSETTARGEASKDSFPVAHKQNELEQQVGLVSFITNPGRKRLL